MTWWQPDEPDSPELVHLGEDQRVPRRFQLPILAGADIPADLLVTVTMDGTRAKIARVEITPTAGVEGVDVDDLARINWPAVVRFLVQLKAMQMMEYWLNAEEAKGDPDAVRSLLRERRMKAERTTTRSVRRNAVTPEYLAEVVALVEKTGSVIKAAEKTGKSRSYIYKLLARAQEELS